MDCFLDCFCNALIFQGDKKAQGYKIHGQQGNKGYGGEKCGTLLKRSEGYVYMWLQVKNQNPNSWKRYHSIHNTSC